MVVRTETAPPGRSSRPASTPASGRASRGRFGTAAGPECGAQPFDRLLQVEDLEGTTLADSLYGGPDSNQLIGRSGADVFFGGAGIDLLLANSADADTTIACGADSDTAVIDHPAYGDGPDSDCESVSAADPKNTG